MGRICSKTSSRPRSWWNWVGNMISAVGIFGVLDVSIVCCKFNWKLCVCWGVSTVLFFKNLFTCSFVLVTPPGRAGRCKRLRGSPVRAVQLLSLLFFGLCHFPLQIHYRWHTALIPSCAETQTVCSAWFTGELIAVPRKQGVRICSAAGMLVEFVVNWELMGNFMFNW